MRRSQFSLLLTIMIPLFFGPPTHGAEAADQTGALVVQPWRRLTLDPEI